MAFADTSTYTLAYAKEVTFDTPITGSGVLQLIRNTGESLNTSLESAKSEEIDSSRQYTGSVHVSGSSAGSLNFQLSYGEYDEFLQAVLQSADWSADYADSGTDVVAATRTVNGVTSTTGVKIGQIMNLTGMSTNLDGIYTVESFVTNTSITFAETFVGDETVSITLANSGVIENGSVERSYTFEKDFSVGGTSNYFLMSGLRAGSLSLAVASGAIISGDIGFMGATGSASGTSTDTGTYLAAGTNELMNGVSNVNGLTLNSVNTAGAFTPVAATFQEVSLAVNNNLRDQNAVGNLFPAGIGSGRITVESSATMYFSDRDLFNQFIVNGSMQLRFQISDAAGNVYGFVIPELKISSHEVTASGPDSDVMASVSFAAVKDTRSQTNASIIVTRITAP